jgi:hypothetical protein
VIPTSRSSRFSSRSRRDSTLLELLPDSLAKRDELVPEMLDRCSEFRDQPGAIA